MPGFLGINGGSRASPSLKLSSYQFFPKDFSIMQLEDREWQSCILFRLVGYGLLLFVLSDLIDILLPPRFMDPVWEFQTIGAVVERMPLPLLGFVLVFFGEMNLRSKWETILLKFLSWAALLIGIALFLLIPLGISDTLRINNQNNAQLNAQASQQISQIQQFEEQLNEATENDLENLLTRIETQDSTQEIQSSQELKERLLAETDKAENTLRTQAEATRSNKRLELLKSSVKWNLGALISGILFIRIWQSTRWARRAMRRKGGW
jgi:hypothetical protein